MAEPSCIEVSKHLRPQDPGQLQSAYVMLRKECVCTSDQSCEMAERWTSGTVGDDVMTVHKVRTRHDEHGAVFLWPVCGAAKKGNEVTEWIREVNCPACVSMD